MKPTPPEEKHRKRPSDKKNYFMADDKKSKNKKKKRKKRLSKRDDGITYGNFQHIDYAKNPDPFFRTNKDIDEVGTLTHKLDEWRKKHKKRAELLEKLAGAKEKSEDDTISYWKEMKKKEDKQKKRNKKSKGK